MMKSVTDGVKKISEEFRSFGRAIVTPAALGVVYPATASALKWLGTGFAAGAAYVATPELHGAWAVAAAVTTGAVTRVMMPIAEDILGITSATVAASLGHKLSGNQIIQPDKRKLHKATVAIIAGTTALAVGGLVGIIEGGRLTYDVAKPMIANFAIKHQTRMATPR
jgi:hypothetical protein